MYKDIFRRIREYDKFCRILVWHRKFNKSIEWTAKYPKTLLAGIIVGSASILYDEIRAMRKELDELKKAEKGARDTE